MDTGGVSFALRIPAEHSAVPFVRYTIVALLTREGWDAESASRILLASSEAISNAIDHGSDAEGVVEVELAICEQRADLWVRDEGRPGATPPVVPDRPPPGHSPTGRGLIIMNRLAQELGVRARGDGTEVHAGFRRGETAPVTAAAA